MVHGCMTLVLFLIQLSQTGNGLLRMIMSTETNWDDDYKGTEKRIGSTHFSLMYRDAKQNDGSEK